MTYQYEGYDRTWRDIPLSKLLEPDFDRDSNSIEQTEQAIGEILAKLVEKSILTLEEALNISGVSADRVRITGV